PDPGWQFSEWSGDLVSNDNPAIITMDANKEITATFVPFDGPIIDVWYGDEQTFGVIGIPQCCVNILGNVSHSSGITSLSYTLNGGSEQVLSMGPFRRLEEDGDFNVEIDYDDLVDGHNQIIITAVNSLGYETSETVIVNYDSGNIWPRNYSVGWSSVNDIQDVAQIVDGQWTLEPDSVKPVVLGYDRLIAIGDIAWTDYEVTVPITIHGIDLYGFEGVNYRPGIGFILRWPGHSDWGDYQPNWGYIPVGGGPWYSFSLDGSGSLTLTDFSSFGVNDPLEREIEYEIKYIWKGRVESMPGVGTLYNFKLWEADQPEPENWELSGIDENDIENGSLLFVAHYVDANFGNISIVSLVDVDPPVITDLSVTIGDTWANIEWNTDEPASCSVDYGEGETYEKGSIVGTSFETQHSILLTDLDPATLYHYQITSADKKGNIANSTDYIFTTD
ncbi:MAG: fibronectin type III domain-containing protein, partial [Thermodesulfovibrionia bacterium]|nr:fibronectin type III domain-containing protein [Thermodesulfovibrionia bacterium]